MYDIRSLPSNTETEVISLPQVIEAAAIPTANFAGVMDTLINETVAGKAIRNTITRLMNLGPKQRKTLMTAVNEMRPGDSLPYMLQKTSSGKHRSKTIELAETLQEIGLINILMNSRTGGFWNITAVFANGKTFDQTISKNGPNDSIILLQDALVSFLIDCYKKNIYSVFSSQAMNDTIKQAASLRFEVPGMENNFEMIPNNEKMAEQIESLGETIAAISSEGAGYAQAA